MPPLGEGLVQNLRQGGGVVPLALVVPVAVGGLHHHIVRAGDGLGVPDDGLVFVADVTGKDDFLLHARFPHPQLYIGAAQQVACVGHAEPEPFHRLQRLSVAHRHQPPDGLLRVRDGVQRFHRLFAGPLALLVLPFGVALLNVSGVQQHDFQQLTGQSSGINRPPVALFHQQRQTAGVVDVGVGHQHRVDQRRGKVESLVVRLVLALL